MVNEVHLPFPAEWQAQILSAAPLIAPARQFIYPRPVPGEEDALARGAMLCTVRPAQGGQFLAMCARGFSDPSLPTGIWSCPRSQEVCLVSGGYACVIDTRAPEKAYQIPLRPVTAIYPVEDLELLVFAGFHTLAAYGVNGLAWETKRLTWEGLSVTSIADGALLGVGWDMMADKDVPFSVDLRTGQHSGGGFKQ